MINVHYYYYYGADFLSEVIRKDISRVIGLFGFIYKVCYFLFNGVVYLFVDGELRLSLIHISEPTRPP